MPYRRLLLATDLSDRAMMAARMGVRLAGQGARLRVAHVVLQAEPPASFMDRLKNKYAELASARRASVEGVVESWAVKGDLPAHETVVLEGSPARAIEKEAREYDADLLVVGARGANRLSTALLGSVSKSLLHRVGCDVLVARGRVEAPGPLRRIAIATDFYEPAKAAARVAAELAERHGAELHLLHVVDRDLWVPHAYQQATPTGQVDQEWVDEAARQMLASFNAETFGGRAREVLRHGAPAHEAAKLVREVDADLLVVGTHGAGALERALVGSVADSIVEGSPSPVLVVRGAP